MKLERTHNFPIDEATARVRALTDYWDKKYGIRTEWDGQTGRVSGRVKGVSFDGRISIDSSCVQAEVKVGFLAERLGGRAYVEHKLNDYLDPANSLEALRARS